LDDDFISRIDNDFFHLVQPVDNFRLVFCYCSPDIVCGFPLQLVCGRFHLLPNVTEAVLFTARFNNFISHDNFNDVIVDGDDDFLSSFDDSVPQVFEIIQYFRLELLEDLEYVTFHFYLQVLGCSLYFVPKVFESIRIRFGRSLERVGDDSNYFALNLNDDFVASVDDDLLDVVQTFDDLWFVFLDGSFHFVTDVVTKLFGSRLYFGPDIIKSINFVI